MIYGYCRISTNKQNIDRQIRNILKAYPKAEIWQETYTGTKTDGRKKFEHLLKIIQSGDVIVFPYEQKRRSWISNLSGIV